MFVECGLGIRFDYRLRHAEVKTWIGNFLAYLHYESRYRQPKTQAEELEKRCQALSRICPVLTALPQAAGVRPS